MEIATGYGVDIAINHDPEAIKMHKTNHPSTKHYCESVWNVDPVKANLPELCIAERTKNLKIVAESNGQLKFA